MLSPLPFFGPVGAVRVGLIDGEFVVNPTLQQIEESTLDLIVVGTKDGLTMVEAGAEEIPEDELLEALDARARGDPKLCEAQEDLRRQVGKAKWLDPEVTAEIEGSHGARDLRADPARTASARRPRSSTELHAELAPELSMDSTEEDIVRQHAGAGQPRACCSRSTGSPPSRARSASSSRTTCAR